ncbi:glycosyltransferase [Xylanimonas ulmi]|uniref:glycosyltransferase n=1 Tax=Xylanimonas ulmi TaxID=228973 RepID=UPI001A920717|nr:glycosyltransferase [Xylanibacterium ulmi]
MRVRQLALATVLVAVVTSAAVAVAVTTPNRLTLFGATFAILLFLAMFGLVTNAWSTARTERNLHGKLEQLARSARELGTRTSHQERTLERIERTGRVAAAAASLRGVMPQVGEESESRRAPHVLFVTSNGSGMGHIARCAAILRHSENVLSGRILTLSTAADIVRRSGYDVGYFPSPSQTERGVEWWRRSFTRRLLEEAEVHRPDVIVFDGTSVYAPLTDVAEFVDVPLVWLRRGLWRAGVDLRQVKRWNEIVSEVITPGDIGESKETAPEPFRDATWVSPISLASTNRPSRDDALRMLGLDPERRYALIQLSGGNGDGSATRAAVEAVSAENGILPVVARSPLFRADGIVGAAILDAPFPLVDFAAAWEFTITGAGYNSVHESLHSGVPGIFVPSNTTLTDDQVRRAESIADIGAGLCARGMGSIAEMVSQISQEKTRECLRAVIDSLNVDNGADEAGERILSFCRHQ